MKRGSAVVSALQHLGMAIEFFESFMRDHPNTQGAKLMKVYSKKAGWIRNDLLTHPSFPPDVVAAMRSEIRSDVFATPAIAEKVALLQPHQREQVEQLIDSLNQGSTISFTINNPTNDKGLPADQVHGTRTEDAAKPEGLLPGEGPREEAAVACG